MMYLGKSKLDKQGRITLPRTFIRANNIKVESEVYFISIINSDNSIKLVFEEPCEATKVK